MYSIILNILFTLLSLLTFVASAPTSLVPRSSGTFIAPAPHFVIYADEWSDQVVPPASKLAGYNVFILAFYLSSGASDEVQAFVSLDESQRKNIINDLHSNGISLMMSVFGSTEAPTTDGVDPESFAAEVAGFVKKYGLDGVDVDYEDFDAINAGNGDAENWLVSFTTALRNHLPSGEYIITHAPVAPWFTTDKGQYPHGAYRTVAQKAGDKIDWYNIQFYNQGIYGSCHDVVMSSPSSFPNTAVKQINEKTGVPLDKLVIGKPATSSDAAQDYMSGGEIASCIQQAKDSLGWNAGAMFWEWHNSGSKSLIETVRSIAFPL